MAYSLLTGPGVSKSWTTISLGGVTMAELGLSSTAKSDQAHGILSKPNNLNRRRSSHKRCCSLVGSPASLLFPCCHVVMEFRLVTAGVLYPACSSAALFYKRTIFKQFVSQAVMWWSVTLLQSASCGLIIGYSRGVQIGSEVIFEWHLAVAFNMRRL